MTGSSNPKRRPWERSLFIWSVPWWWGHLFSVWVVNGRRRRKEKVMESMVLKRKTSRSRKQCCFSTPHALFLLDTFVQQFNQRSHWKGTNLHFDGESFAGDSGREHLSGSKGRVVTAEKRHVQKEGIAREYRNWEMSTKIERMKFRCESEGEKVLETGEAKWVKTELAECYPAEVNWI